MKKYEVEKLVVNVTSFMFGGLIVCSLVILQDLISSEVHDIAGIISVSCLGLALPVLAGSLVVNYIGRELISREPASESQTPTWATILIWMAMSIDIIGITAAIWRASWIASILFFTTSIISFRIYYPICRKMIQKAYTRVNVNHEM